MLVVDTLLTLQIEENIGQEGRNSEVHIATDPQLNAKVVVKKVQKSEFTNTAEYFSEAQKLYDVSHPNIMSVRYASQDNDNVYIVMDYYKKGSLNKVIQSRFLSVREIIKYSLEFLSGIHYMHSKNMIHFDLKPTNILINDAGKAVVTDFGLSKYLNENGFAQPSKLYPLHVPPETFNFGQFSFFTDIYQAGLTIYRMCNGNSILQEQLDSLGIKDSKEFAEVIIRDIFPKKELYLPHIPEKLQKIIKKALAIDPTKRFETVLDMMNELCLIDDNLDWFYNEITNEHSVWTKENETHVLQLIVKKIESKWVTEGYKVWKDKKPTKVSNWHTDGYSYKESAFEAVRKFLNN
jgi:eukaryotic-like serine/threonine-protein kinase